MGFKIDQDRNRFRQIVKGHVRDNLKRYISQGELIGRQGQKSVSIPLPQIDIPRFRFDDQQGGGAGQGEGEPGDPLDGQEGDGDGSGRAGNQAGQHGLDVDVTLDELADLLGQELALPDIQNKGRSSIDDHDARYTGIRRVGPESLRHFRRTYREALKRQIATGGYRPDIPIIPIREDKRYRSARLVPEPNAQAVILYMMDVSGSMGDEQKETVRITSFWIDTWLRRQYRGLESRYIVHDVEAREVDRDTFFSTAESGGTAISGAYRLCADILDADYPASDWNVYPFHFSDGDNWSIDDTVTCVSILQDRLLPRVNMFAYGQVTSPYGSGQFLKDLRDRLGQDDRLVTSEIADRDAIVQSIRDFLGKGK